MTLPYEKDRSLRPRMRSSECVAECILSLLTDSTQSTRMMMTEIKPLVVRIPPELRAELEPIAATERRSLRNTICAALCEWLEDRSNKRRDWRRGYADPRTTRVRRPIQRSQQLGT
jgi:hypothetical protein